MIEYAVIAGLAWWYGASGRPKTKVEKSKLLGPRSGQTWEAETIPDLGVVIVHGKLSKVAFRRTPAGMIAAKTAGHPQEIALILKDFDATPSKTE
jgi:hypothetical protein